MSGAPAGREDTFLVQDQGTVAPSPPATWLVTGIGIGIGKAIARDLAAARSRLAIGVSPVAGFRLV